MLTKLNKKVKIKLFIIVLIVFNYYSYSQNFGDSYYSVLNKVQNISKKSTNKSIECKYDIGGIEGVKIYGFESRGKLASLITRQYLDKTTGKILYDSYYSDFYSKFGSPTIKNEKEYCSDGVDCYKLKSKWIKNYETIILNYYTSSGESLVQLQYMKDKNAL